MKMRLVCYYELCVPHPEYFTVPGIRIVSQRNQLERHQYLVVLRIFSRKI